MAQYNGYVTVPHGSYDEWRRATYGNGYNVDFAWGNQCWDYCSLLYYQYRMTLITGGKYAYQCWTLSRKINSRSPFIAIEGKENIKRGDIIVFNRHGNNKTGHIAFADEDYNGSNYIRIVGQNQGGANGNVNDIKSSLTFFLGIFRNTLWKGGSPSPTPDPEPDEDDPRQRWKKDFPWAVAWNNWYGFMDDL